MKKLSFILLAICFAFASCSNDNESTMEEDSARLDKMYDDIVAYTQINSTPCSNPEEWGFIQSQNNSCGGNAGYIAYSKKIDLSILQKKIENYGKAKNSFYIKWGILNDVCQWKAPPTNVECVDGKPKLIFGDLIS
ncbi:hypothetical protein [Flavobacterium reichenbachii]|uniref:Lipoprotein n=1 Tax=Flavobacterium reichenbachii TaxID=362418 RepID=A0A085ZN93_9FLAO|nr:hypothetical protein [Flavobacterium reichenbachii]KFF05907.1 hypothetical protein IW19_10415 [Flavobacterium reichenbachii]OXB12793.1 hypothetical protein B0A68_18580 [Flavobacterium reichenbachii]